MRDPLTLRASAMASTPSSPSGFRFRIMEVTVLLILKADAKDCAPVVVILLLPRLTLVMDLLTFKTLAKAAVPLSKSSALSRFTVVTVVLHFRLSDKARAA